MAEFQSVNSQKSSGPFYRRWPMSPHDKSLRLNGCSHDNNRTSSLRSWYVYACGYFYYAMKWVVMFAPGRSIFLWSENY